MLTHLIFDVDGVLRDWSRAFLTFVRKRGHIQRSLVHRRWDMACCFPHLSPAEISRLIDEFHESDLYANLEPLPGADDAVATLAHRFSTGVKFVAVTACGLSPKTLMNRLKHLQHLPLSEIHTVAVTASKRDMFAQFPAASSIVFEDRDKNADVALGLGMRVIMLDHPYNAHYVPPRPATTRLYEDMPADPAERFFRAEGWGHALECQWLNPLPAFSPSGAPMGWVGNEWLAVGPAPRTQEGRIDVV